MSETPARASCRRRRRDGSLQCRTALSRVPTRRPDETTGDRPGCSPRRVDAHASATCPAAKVQASRKAGGAAATSHAPSIPLRYCLPGTIPELTISTPITSPSTKAPTPLSTNLRRCGREGAEAMSLELLVSAHVASAHVRTPHKEAAQNDVMFLPSPGDGSGRTRAASPPTRRRTRRR
jgi:hypothetical protein